MIITLRVSIFVLPCPSACYSFISPSRSPARAKAVHPSLPNIDRNVNFVFKYKQVSIRGHCSDHCILNQSTPSVRKQNLQGNYKNHFNYNFQNKKKLILNKNILLR